jgi:pyruvate,water dikinase
MPEVELLSGVIEPKVLELGGKAYSLSVMIKNGFNVPNGIVIKAEAFFSFLRKNNIDDEIERKLQSVNTENAEEKSQQIKTLILKGHMPEDIVVQIINHVEVLNLRRVAIRSSAASEDSSGSSFAGLHDTFLNIKAESSSIFEYVKKCYASLFNDRAIYYRIRKGLPFLEGMAVIVQEMIDPEFSGTTLTVHPDKLDTNLMVIEGTYGVGEAVVGGLVSPDRFIVDKRRNKIVEKVLGRKKVTVCLKSDQEGTVVVNTPENATSRFSLSEASVESIAKVCTEVERLFMSPQDIEWCLAKERIWLLQSRCITSLRALA